MKSLFRYFQNLATFCDVIIPNFREMDKLGNSRTTCRTDTKIGIWSILKEVNAKLKSLFRYFQNLAAYCDVIIPNFREMDQIREQQNYLSGRH